MVTKCDHQRGICILNNPVVTDEMVERLATYMRCDDGFIHMGMEEVKESAREYLEAAFYSNGGQA